MKSVSLKRLCDVRARGCFGMSRWPFTKTLYLQIRWWGTYLPKHMSNCSYHMQSWLLCLPMTFLNLRVKFNIRTGMAILIHLIFILFMSLIRNTWKLHHRKFDNLVLLPCVQTTDQLFTGFLRYRENREFEKKGLPVGKRLRIWRGKNTKNHEKRLFWGR